MKKEIRIAVTHTKAKALGIPHTSTRGVVSPFEIDLESLTPAARWVAEHITATYILDEYTDKNPIQAVAGFTMAERDRASGKSEEYIASFTRAYGSYYTEERMKIPVSFPFYGNHMNRPEDVIEEAVRQCVAAGTAQFTSGPDCFSI